jgi:hypothetical protein
MSKHIPLGENVLIKARDSRQSKYFNAPKSEFDQTQTVGTLISLGADVPDNYKNIIGKIVFFPSFHEVRATADPDAPEVFVNYKLIAGYEEESNDSISD